MLSPGYFISLFITTLMLMFLGNRKLRLRNYRGSTSLRIFSFWFDHREKKQDGEQSILSIRPAAGAIGVHASTLGARLEQNGKSVTRHF